MVFVGTVSGLPPGAVMECFVGDAPYAICNHNGTIRALSGICPHSGGPLGQGQLHNGLLVCPYHMWEFDCATGEYDFDPAKRVETFAVKVQGDDILLEAPQRA